ncbi:MAG: hypothetical protein ACYCV0_07585 [Desulfitobacteriaceae bacterium]
MFKLIPKIIERARPTTASIVKPSVCSVAAASCPQCGYPLDGPAMSCPRCRQPLETGCSGSCSKCSAGGSSCTSCK